MPKSLAVLSLVDSSVRFAYLLRLCAFTCSVVCLLMVGENTIELCYFFVYKWVKGLHP